MSLVGNYQLQNCDVVRNLHPKPSKSQLINTEILYKIQVSFSHKVPRLILLNA